MSLLEELNELIEKSEGIEVGLVAHRLESGEEILINPDRSFHPASTMKICVMLEVFRQARKGLFLLNGSIRVRNEFTSIADGSKYSLSSDDDSEKELYQHIGQRMPVGDLVQRMITVSSNLATNILIELVTPDRTNSFMRELGAEGLIVRRGVEDNNAFGVGLNNAATARGFKQILMKLAKREVVSHEDSDEMIDILARQQFNEMIPAQLPEQVRTAHKTGWTGEYYHDVGIVYPPDTGAFVLVILTRGFHQDKDAHPFIASLAKTIYGHWAGQISIRK
jgi:beta-lactamase class A